MEKIENINIKQLRALYSFFTLIGACIATYLFNEHLIFQDSTTQGEVLKSSEHWIYSTMLFFGMFILKSMIISIILGGLSVLFKLINYLFLGNQQSDFFDKVISFGFWLVWYCSTSPGGHDSDSFAYKASAVYKLKASPFLRKVTEVSLVDLWEYRA